MYFLEMSMKCPEFISRFGNIKKSIFHEFSPTISRGMYGVEEKLKKVDCIIEMHDARMPLSGRNPVFSQRLNVRPRLLVLNKADLADLRQKEKILETLTTKDTKEIIFSNLKQGASSLVKHQIIPAVLRLIGNDSHRFELSGATHYNMIVLGVPNVGKSSLINVIRMVKEHGDKRKKAATVGSVAGVTKSVQQKIKVSENPLLYMYDSPGIAYNKIDDVEVGLKMAACGCFKDRGVGTKLISDYILYWLNNHDRMEYVKRFDIPSPTDDINKLLITICKRGGLMLSKRMLSGHMESVPDYEQAGEIFLKEFRAGNLGKVNFDEDLL